MRLSLSSQSNYPETYPEGAGCRHWHDHWLRTGEHMYENLSAITGKTTEMLIAPDFNVLWRTALEQASEKLGRASKQAAQSGLKAVRPTRHAGGDGNGARSPSVQNRMLHEENTEHRPRSSTRSPR